MGRLTAACGALLALAACGTPEAPPPSEPSLWRDLSAGRAHTCGVDDAGALWCWGAGASGQLGHGARGARAVPTLVPHPSGSAWSAVSSGGAHTCALDEHDALWCWGAGASGQLGQGRLVAEPTPTRSLSGDFARVSAGAAGTCAARASGEVWCWGDGARAARRVEGADARGGLAVGDSGGCARGADSALTCWGPLGGGDAATIALPEPWRTLDARGERACGLDDAGALWCVGVGGVGFGAWPGDRLTPWRVASGPFDASSLGPQGWCGREEGVWRCAGTNRSGELGAGVAPLPDPAAMGTTRWDGVALGARHGCAHAGDRWTCWGSTRDGRLGDGRYARALVPERVAGVDGAVALTAADLQTCALGPGGVSCWGSSALGAAADGSRALDASVRALEAPAGLVALEMGAGHVAALDGEGEAYHAEPTSPGLTRLGVPEPLGALASGPLGACGLTQAGMPSCWAPTGREQAPRALTTEVEPAFDALALGPDFQCGIARGTAALWCWGSNLAGQLGVGDRTPRTLPSVAWTEPVRRVSVSLSHGCAVTRAGALLCWGDNARGQLPSRARALLDPTPVPGGPWADVEVGFSHGCALDEGGAAFCWGDNEAGALGDGTTTSRREPTRVASEQTFAELAVGATHTCARTEGGEVWCWGAGDLGQLGDPARAGKHAP